MADETAPQYPNRVKIQSDVPDTWAAARRPSLFRGHLKFQLGAPIRLDPTRNSFW
jgi:hypothetical protein